jgi:hypothetical protein
VSAERASPNICGTVVVKEASVRERRKSLRFRNNNVPTSGFFDGIHTFKEVKSGLWHISSKYPPELLKVKVKVMLSMCLTNKALRHEGVWGSGCIDPHFLDLGISWSE